jgi:hypothetical protein
MNASHLEVIPSTWDDDRDTAFFAITAHVFSHDFCVRASALLPGVDPDRSSGPPARELVPVPVRRLR